MKNARLYKIIIIVLVALNLATLAFMWFNRPGRERSGERQGAAANFLIKELKLTAEQQKEYMQLRQEHRELLNKLSEQDRVLHTHFFDLLRKEVPDTATVHLFANLITTNRKQMEIVTYDHFARISKMLTPDQQKKFNLVLQDVLLMVLPPPPPPSNVPPPPLPPPPSPF
ncbi:MAG: periplasmic heavy metal sensor [Bacteroidetes bacterium]|nr:periplasmic heavy metal sensor [Bacteroidota bacterium]